jgi:hypothetical protein
MFAIDAGEWGLDNLVKQFRLMREKIIPIARKDTAA